MNKTRDFNRDRENLTEQDLEEIFDLLAPRMRSANKALLWRRLTEHLSMIPHYGILSRIMQDSHGWSYCAGQDYTEEIKTVRKIILDCK